MVFPCNWRSGKLSLWLVWALGLIGTLGATAGWAKVTAYSAPPEYHRASQLYTVTMDGNPVSVLVSTGGEDGPIHYARAALAGGAKVAVTVSHAFKKEAVHFTGLVGNAQASDHELKFEVDGPRYVMLEIDDLEPLCLLLDPEETEAPRPHEAGVTEAVAPDLDPTGQRVATRAIQTLIDRVSARGGGILYFGPGLYRTGTLLLKSNVSLYLHGDAVLLGARSASDFPPIGSGSHKGKTATARALLYAIEAHDVRVFGRGVIDANGDGTDFKGILAAMGLIRCDRLRLEGITLLNGRGWTVVGFSQHVNIQRFKSLQPMLHATDDALDICNCQDVQIDHCLLAAGDDSFCVKTCSTRSGMASTWGYREDETRPLSAEQVELRHSFLFSNAAAIKIGIQAFRDIRHVVCEDLDIVRGRALNIAHSQGTGVISNVVFRDIRFGRVASAKQYKAPTTPIDFVTNEVKGTPAPRGGAVQNVLLQNVAFGTVGQVRSRIAAEGEYAFSGVRLIGVTIAGRPVTDAASGDIEVTGAVHDLTFER